MLPLPEITNILLDAINQEVGKDHPLENLRCRMSKYYGEPEFAKPDVKDNKYSIALDFRKFKPEEVEVKFGADNMLQISGKHEQMSEDGSSYVYRQYIHHFSVPDNVEHEQLKSKLDTRGILRIEAPVKQEDKVESDGSRNIPVEFIKN